MDITNSNIININTIDSEEDKLNIDTKMYFNEINSNQLEVEIIMTDTKKCEHIKRENIKLDNNNVIINDYDSDSISTYSSELSDVSFTEEERTDILENAISLIRDIIHANPLVYMYPNYKENITDEVYDVLESQLNHLYLDYNIENELQNIIEDAFKLIHKHYMPIRSFKKTFIRSNIQNPKRKEKYIKHIQHKLEHIKNKPQPPQKSAEWYEHRHGLLTASNLWKIFSTPATKNQLIYEKCKPYDPNKYNFVSTESTLHWGNKYEPISVMFYEKHYNTKLDDYGCLVHDKYSYLAASPDGINICPNSKRYGRMLEIKNIVNREINGKPKMEYWIQMQIQMEVCNLNECDFLETRFIEYASKEDFDNDGSFTRTDKHDLKGIMIQFTKNDKPFYEYAPLEISEKAFENWQTKIMEKHKDSTWIKNIYWKLDEISCVLVLRNKTWFNAAFPEIEKTWKLIQEEKINGYQHRAPKRKEKKDDISKSKVKVIKKNGDYEENKEECPQQGTCLIDVNLLE